ncbi:hypothetical protein GX888_01225 [Candidatus Dojkabacteria bacterium]|uniref:Uncharacterized protein n=1 Tax=Candidatus Dojkabacteria bacterium TaxID=2099670 RepID=A0A847VDE0_9BACT|nr:hypothetical protein [Candidatus Dojkabacteria bacterium]
MKNFLRKLIQYLLVAYFVLTLFENITLPLNFFYHFSCIFAIAIIIFFSSFILNFLTIKENFLTCFLMTLILSIGIFFLLKAFMPGFFIQSFTFEGIDTRSLVIHNFEVTVVYTIIIASMAYSFITALLNTLEKNS